MLQGELIGRARELDQLAALVDRQPLVTLTGAPGVGKSHLARALGARLAADDDLPFLWCDLACLGEVHAASDVGAALAEQLGLGSADALRATLDLRRHLLVLDGWEQGPDGARGFVEEVLGRHPDVRLLATGQRPLRLDPEFVWVLPPLPVPDPDADPPEALAANPAVSLYAARSASAGAAVPDDPGHLRLVARLVAQLDGLPLGIELAAARARTLGPGDLLARTDEQLDLLRTSRGTGTSRGDSLRASLDVSYAALAPAEQALLRALSVFRGSVAGDLVHSVCAPEGADPVDSADLLDALVGCSLVQAEPGSGGLVRYRLLNVVRRYAGDRLAEAGEVDAVEDRCVERLAALADGFVTQAVEAWSEELVGRMLGCFRTLTGAIELALRRDPDASRAVRIYLPLYSAVHGVHAGEVAALGDAILRRWPTGDEPLRREAMAVLSAAHLLAGDTARAAELAGAVLAAEGDVPGLASVLACRTAGFAAAYGGDRAAALDHLDRGVALAEALGGPFARELSVAGAAVRAAEPEAAAACIDELGALAVRCAGADEPVNQMWALAPAGRLLSHAMSTRWAFEGIAGSLGLDGPTTPAGTWAVLAGVAVGLLGATTALLRFGRRAARPS